MKYDANEGFINSINHFKDSFSLDNIYATEYLKVLKDFEVDCRSIKLGSTNGDFTIDMKASSPNENIVIDKLYIKSNGNLVIELYLKDVNLYKSIQYNICYDPELSSVSYSICYNDHNNDNYNGIYYFTRGYDKNDNKSYNEYTFYDKNVLNFLLNNTRYEDIHALNREISYDDTYLRRYGFKPDLYTKIESGISEKEQGLWLNSFINNINSKNTFNRVDLVLEDYEQSNDSSISRILK